MQFFGKRGYVVHCDGELPPPTEMLQYMSTKQAMWMVHRTPTVMSEWRLKRSTVCSQRAGSKQHGQGAVPRNVGEWEGMPIYRYRWQGCAYRQCPPHGAFFPCRPARPAPGSQVHS